MVEKAFAYISNLSREGRKAVTTEFEQKYKGLNFDQVESTVRKEVEAWFAVRDRNVKISHERTSLGRPGELLITYIGSNKDAHFKFNVHGIFVVTSPTSPSYLKQLNFDVDKRDFRK